MRKGKIDVVVVTYNEERYIRQCLDSILMQTIKDDIVIYVGDDASSDGTPRIIAEYVKRYPDQIIPVFHKRNIGASANLRHLLEMADSEYVAFCDGDDYWISADKLEQQREFLLRHPQYIGNVHDVKIVNGLGENIEIQHLEWLSSSDDMSLADYDGMHLPGQLSSLCVRNFKYMGVKDLSLMDTDRQISDKIVFLLALTCGKIHRSSRIMGAYRLVRVIGKDNASSLRIESISTMDINDMHLVNCMEHWLIHKTNQRNKFIEARSQILVTAIFHKIKYNGMHLFDVWKKCRHKVLVLAYLPLAIYQKVIIRICMKLGKATR